jgi:hypothetical protein
MTAPRLTMPTRSLFGPQPMAWTPAVDTDIRRLFAAVRLELEAEEYARQEALSSVDLFDGKKDKK